MVKYLFKNFFEINFRVFLNILIYRFYFYFKIIYRLNNYKRNIVFNFYVDLMVIYFFCLFFLVFVNLVFFVLVEVMISVLLISELVSVDLSWLTWVIIDMLRMLCLRFMILWIWFMVKFIWKESSRFLYNI